MTMVAPSAALVPVGGPQNGVSRTRAAVAIPATSEAAAYLQTAAIKDETANRIGRPAYQKAGTTRVQYDALHAAAIPLGPQGSATRNKDVVTVSSTRAQRNQRSGF